MVAYPVPLQNKSELRPYSRQTPFATATETSQKGMGEAGQDALKCSRARDHVTALRNVLERLLHWLLPADLKSCDSAKRLPTRKLREGWRTQSS